MRFRAGLTLTSALLLSGLTILAAFAAPAKPGDWPQWQGPNRDNVSKETGLLQTWPMEGPTLSWRAEGLGYGYTTPTVAGGRIYGMGFKNGQESVWALDEKNGHGLWMTPFSTPQQPDPNNRGAGPRGSVTVDGKQLFGLGVNGDLVCLDTDGKILWQKSLLRDLGGSMSTWGYSESPLVDGDKVIVTPGGGGATMAGLNKSNGEVAWKCVVPGNRAQYSSPIVAVIDGQRQYIQMTRAGVIGVSTDGQLLWTFAFAAGNTAACPTPVYRDGFVFAAAGYGAGAGLGKINHTGGTWSVEPVYSSKDLVNHHGGIALLGDYVYGIHDAAGLSCLDFKTGALKWSDRSVGKGSIVIADGRIYARRESSGEMALVDASPAGLSVKGRFTPPRDPDQPNASPPNMAWAHPVVTGGKLYVRDQNWLLCYDVKAPG